MALPRIVSMDLLRKDPWTDGNILLTFLPKTTLNEAKGGAFLDGTHYGKLQVLVSPAAAADFTVGTTYTWTAT